MNELERERVEWELLWLRCRRSDPEVLEVLVRKLERPLHYFIRRIVANEADAWDVMQQLWISVFANMRHVAAASTLKPWIYRTARNMALNQLRGDRRYRTVIEQTADMAVEHEPAGQEFENAEEVHRALDRLDLPHREVLTLYFLEQMSVLDMANILDLPAGTVKSRLFHGRRQLRSIMENHDE